MKRDSSSKELTNRILFDWLSFTTQLWNPMQLIEFLGLDSCSWQQISGQHGYKDRYYCEGISIHYNGREDMGVWLEMSGKGCRYYEDYGCMKWAELFTWLLSEPSDTHITRLDVAYDDFEGLLDINTIYDAVDNYDFVSRWRKCQLFKSKDTVTHEDALTVQMGSRASRCMLRIYDKKQEQQLDDEAMKHWVRMELQLRDDDAVGFIRSYSTGIFEIGDLFLAVVNNYVRFIVPSDTDSNRWRWKMVEWWAQFIGAVERIRLVTTPGAEYTIANLEHFVIDQAGQAAKTYIDIMGIDAYVKSLMEHTFHHNPKYDRVREHAAQLLRDLEDLGGEVNVTCVGDRSLLS